MPLRPDKQATPRVAGYARLYDEILSLHTFKSTTAENYAGPILMLATLLAILSVIPYLSNVRNQGFLPAISFIWVIVIAGMALTLIITIVSAHATKPEKRSNGLAAFLLTLASCPRQRTIGLLPDHIRHLQRFAEIEQGSADWRSNYMTIIIVTTAIVILGAAPDIASLLSPDQGFVQIEVHPYFLENDRYPSYVLGIYSTFGLLFVGSLWLLCRMYQDIRSFLMREVANRTLLFACEEAMALLSEQWLDKAAALDFDTRKMLAERLGYTVVRQDQFPKLRPANLEWDAVRDDDGVAWILVPVGFGDAKQR